MLWITLVMFWVSGCLAYVSYPEVCPALETVSNFDIPGYMGLWYEAEKYFAEFQTDGKCVTAKYTLNENGTVLVENSQISSTTGLVSSIEGTATPIGDAGEAKLSVVFPTVSSEGAPYWVVGTDYTNWAVVWSCRNDGSTSRRHSWILTRERNPSAAVLEQAYQTADRHNISREHFIKTDQTNCPTS